ncbi:regulator of chromosome condensation [Aphis gossypii]|uniref:regulator of chromosome condensation n=1 Tax=Aphis gossypii TaxID=80765 RepID=UPI00215967E7|nr:regulator of chromosome condensation [Aphis gossypii]XP_027842414.2 regulator of chromosome condensation [Aphis gossypii]
MAGKKKAPTKAVAKNTTKTNAEQTDVPSDVTELNGEPIEVNGVTGVEELAEPDVISKTNGKQVVKTKKSKGQKNNVEVEVSDDKLITVKSKRNNQSNGDEKQSTSNPKKSISTNGTARTKRKQEPENLPQSTSSKRSKRKSLEEQAIEVKRKKTEKTSDKIAIDNRIETPGIMMIKGRDIVIAGLFGLGPDREQLTNLTELKNYKFKLIAAGSMHVLGVTEDGKLMSWGCNDEGALGRDTSVEDSETRPGVVQIPEEEGAEIYSISAGGSHSAILLSNGNVYSWGTFRDKNGDMGFHPDGKKQLTPKLIMSNVKKIASGINHLVMLSKNKVYTMGCGDEGQLGRICQRHSNRDSRVGKQLLLNPQLLNLRKKVDDIWANYDTTFLRLSDSSIYSFGLNAHGQLGVENDDKCVYFPQMSESLSRLKIKSISAGTQHVTLLDEQGAVYVLGDYKDGRLGMDIAENQKVPKVLSSLPQIKLATCGSDNSFVVTENNKLMAWGIGFEEKDDNDVIYYIPTDVDAANRIDQKTIVQATSSDSAVFLLLQD